MLAFIIQARLGSTRLPGKILLPFSGDKSIFDLLLEKFCSIDGACCIVATTDSPVNDKLEEICLERGVKCFRGSENDVLQRFIDAAGYYGVDRIIRVCSDNPFLNVPAVHELIEASSEGDWDYISFNIGGTPAVKTHYGFWTEYVTLDALRRVKSLTDEPLYHEHVTNFIYAHPELFSIKWLDVPPVVLENKDTRLTIDTAQDFANAREIYASTNDRDSFESLFACIKAHEGIAESMKNQIINNSK